MEIPAEKEHLELTFAGRIIEHLGIDMYQSPVAAITELVANSWDAEAETVMIQLPEEKSEDMEIIIEDDGLGMTWEECKERFLHVGYNRRGDDPQAVTAEKNRPILGRKGIGKFAGFGIANVVRVETVSKENGERTVFEMDADELRSDSYEHESKKLDVIEYEGPNNHRAKNHGTKITLRRLTGKRRPSLTQFPKSMARRFLLHQRADDFEVRVNGNPLPQDPDLDGIEFEFPGDYDPDEVPENLEIDPDGFGLEELENGQTIRWRFVFYEDTLSDEELSGASIFANGKLAQTPFEFNLVGGIGGQQGLEYFSGRVEANFIDRLDEDVIATERQRINWNHPQVVPLEQWGQSRLKEVLRIWKRRRREKKEERLKEKLTPFSDRLDRLQSRERKTIETALLRVARVPKLGDTEFDNLCNAMLTAWEKGRLRQFIGELADAEEISAEDLVEMLMEADVLTALHMAEIVTTRLGAVRELKRRIEDEDLENNVRDYIAENPWLISPEWETFERERSIKHIVKKARMGAKLDDLIDDGGKRIDLVMSSGRQLLILEFMRPAKPLDLDHVNRFEAYVDIIRDEVTANTGTDFNSATGYLVADRISEKSANRRRISRLKDDDKYVMDWKTLLGKATNQWADFLDAVVARSPDDSRLKIFHEMAELS